MRTRIKICGITRVEDAQAAVDAGADAIGLVFWPGTPRVVTHAQAQRIVATLPPYVTTVGLFVEEQLDWKGRLFLTGGLRADDNSSFGAEFNFVTYPKVSAAWVISEEPFWRPLRFIQTLRLRAAYGTSGQQPDAFSALRTYAAISGPGDVSAVRPLAPGNPRLGPERGQELDASRAGAPGTRRLRHRPRVACPGSPSRRTRDAP